MEEIVQEQLLEIKHLEKSYEDDSPVLKDISLSVKKGEVVVLLGPSGCGKSTLLRTIMGLEHIQGGEILLEGKNIVGKSAEARKERQNLGMVFQSYDLFPHMSILENLLLAPMKVQGRKREEAVQEARELLARVHLSDKENAYPSMLSGGQKQRVAIIRSLMMHPKLMLFDEVTAALDPEMVREVLDVVMELSEQGLTMLIVTHEMGFAKAVADRVLFLDGGKVLEENTPENFFQKPDTERAQQFLQNFSYVSHRHVGR
jgi:ABC superfamily ATP binding cassette transporter, ABC protein